MKKVRFEEKSKLRGKFKDTSNFSKRNVYYDGILNGKIPDYSCYCKANNQILPKFQQRKRELPGNS